MTLYEKIFLVIREIPKGKVATYGQVAGIVKDCGARTVGYALNTVKEGDQIPWYRVLNSKGKSSLGEEGAEMQKAILEKEGVLFNQNGTVDLKTYQWEGRSFEEV